MNHPCTLCGSTNWPRPNSDCVLCSDIDVEDDEEESPRDDCPTPKTEQAVIDLIRSRGVVGLQKYGTTMDRHDLKPSEWIQHLQEELADGLQYAERIKGAEKLLEEAREIIATLADERGWEIAADWVARYDERFTP
jgi:hypothetical protein